MKFNAPILALLSSITATSSWTLGIDGSDGRHSDHSGTLGGCNDISFTPAIEVNRANFNPVTDWLPDATEFELYVNRGCNGLSYRNGGGNHVIQPPRVIRSYKVIV